MKGAAQLSASLMSDAKWRKFFRIVSKHSEEVFSAGWKLVGEREPEAGRLPRMEDIWASAVDGCLGGPITYSEIEWIDLPKSISYRPYANAPVKRKPQNLDALRQALDAVGQFPTEETENGIRIYGYHR